MNVKLEEKEGLNAVLTVEIAPEDYQKNVDDALSKYRRQASFKGFRPGHAPMSLVKKQYGKAILADELQKSVEKSLTEYLSKADFEMLGRPIPSAENEVVGDFENPDKFEFNFDIAKTPNVEVKLSAKNKFDYFKIKVDADLVDKQMSDFRRRYGKLSSAEDVQDTDMVLGQFVELDEAGEIKPGGILHSSTVSLEFIEDKKAKKDFVGKKLGDKVIVSADAISRGEADKAAMLGVKKEELEGVSDSFQFTINEIKRMELAELNQELFDKLFGEGEISDEKAMRERISNDLSGMFKNDSDKLLTRHVYEHLMENTKVDLPDSFLKRFIKASTQTEITDEQIEAEYDMYAKGLKWQLIQGELFKANDVKVEFEEVMNYTKGLIIQNYAQYGMPAPEDKELSATAMNILKDQKESNRIYDMLAETKLTEIFMSTVKMNEKEISYDDFMKKVSEV